MRLVQPAGSRCRSGWLDRGLPDRLSRWFRRGERVAEVGDQEMPDTAGRHAVRADDAEWGDRADLRLVQVRGNDLLRDSARPAALPDRETARWVPNRRGLLRAGSARERADRRLRSTAG